MCINSVTSAPAVTFFGTEALQNAVVMPAITLPGFVTSPIRPFAIAAVATVDKITKVPDVVV